MNISGSPMVIIPMSILAVISVLLLYREKLLDNNKRLVFAVVGIVLAFVLRTICINHVTLDYIDFLSHWVQYFRDYGGVSALSDSIGNYNLPYLYFLSLFSYLKIPDLYLIKLLSIIFDIVLAWACMKLCGVISNSKNKKLITFLSILLLPTVILNGSYWGQCDGIYVAFGVLSIWLALDNRPVLSIVCISLSFAFKLQAVFLMPVFFVLMLNGKIKIKHLPVFPVTYIITALPAIFAGRPFLDTITLYFNQTGSIGDGLNYNSPSVFAFIRNASNTEFLSTLGIIFAFLFIFIIYIWLIIKRKYITEKTILLVSALFCTTIPFFLPHMHDRYFFAADIFSFILAVIIPRCYLLPILVSFASLLGYHAYLKMFYILPMNMGSCALIIVISILITEIYSSYKDVSI